MRYRLPSVAAASSSPAACSRAAALSSDASTETMNLALGVLRGRYPGRAAALVSGRHNRIARHSRSAWRAPQADSAPLACFPASPCSSSCATAGVGGGVARRRPRRGGSRRVSGRLAEADYRHILSEWRIAMRSSTHLRRGAQGLRCQRGRAARRRSVAAFDADADTPAFCLYCRAPRVGRRPAARARAGSVVICPRARPCRRGAHTSRFSFAYGLEHGLLASRFRCDFGAHPGLARC